jgi:predicted Zn finger-like uncharacterized protein
MRFRFRCPNCAFKYGVRIDQAGKSGRCKRCGTVLRVPRFDKDFDNEATGDLTTATVEVTIGGPIAFIKRLFRI